MVNSYMSRPKFAMLLIGLWPPPEMLLLKIPYFFYRCIVIFSVYSFLASLFIYIMSVLGGDLAEAFEGSYLFFTQFTLTLKSTSIMLKKNKFKRVLNLMDNKLFAPQTAEHEKIMSGQAITMWKILLFFFFFSLLNCVEWAVFPLIENPGIRVFPFKMWMPFDVDKDPDYCIGYLYQVLAISLNAMIFICIDCTTATIVMFAAAQLDIIAAKLRQIPPVPQTAAFDDEERKILLTRNNAILNECIQQHQEVIRFIELVENLFSLNLFFQLSLTVAIICFIGFRITQISMKSVEFISSVNYMTTVLALLYLFCWSGNELTHRGQVLRDDLYMCSWVQQDHRFRKTLAMAMECMKRPIILRVGYFIPLSRPTFVSILRCSYSYFAVLNQVNN